MARSSSTSRRGSRTPRVTVAFLVATAAVELGKKVTMFLTNEAVRLGLPGYADAVACEGCPPLQRLYEQYASGGGELLVCPICFNARKLGEAALVANASLGGATRLWDWIGDDAPSSATGARTRDRGGGLDRRR